MDNPALARGLGTWEGGGWGDVDWGVGSATARRPRQMIAHRHPRPDASTVARSSISRTCVFRPQVLHNSTGLTTEMMESSISLIGKKPSGKLPLRAVSRERVGTLWPVWISVSGIARSGCAGASGGAVDPAGTPGTRPSSAERSGRFAGKGHRRGRVGRRGRRPGGGFGPGRGRRRR